MKAVIANILGNLWIWWLQLRIWGQHVRLAYQHYQTLRLTFKRDSLLKRIEALKSSVA